MIHHFKSMVFATFIACTTVSAGCGGVVEEANVVDNSLKSQESPVRSSAHCSDCSGGGDLCCTSPNHPDTWQCTHFYYRCETGCPSTTTCGLGGFCIPNDGRTCEELSG
jgi:hypothetical protein